MLPWILFLAAVPLPARIGVVLSERAEMPLESALALTHQLGAAIQRRTQLNPIFDEPPPDWAVCEIRDSCIPGVRARTGAQEVVVVRLFPALTLVRLLAFRHSSEKRPPIRIQRDLPLDPRSRGLELEQVAALLFPERASPPAPSVTVSTESWLPRGIPLPDRRWVPWIGLGATVLVAGVGVGFGVDAAAQQRQASSMLRDKSSYQPLRDHAERSALDANVCFALAVVTFAGSVISKVLLE